MAVFPPSDTVPRPTLQFITPDSPDWLAATRQIFTEYAMQLGIDLCFQNFDDELADLPGQYSEPRGALLLALVDGEIAGCCGLRALDSVDYPNAAEMKRLYVRKAFRRFGLGRQLAETMLDRARMAGYQSVLLDTLNDMESARALYADLGFVDIPPYYHNPMAGAHYLMVDL
ncbi:Histone acetyltransferase HPA2 and related acetyltransferases [Polaromonas sp. CG9_12]|nr:Histone acetyltransferase HPA2 and related acetyltransferases [Polaromonas sp. CG9_12]